MCDHEDEDSTPRRFRTLRFNPLRDLMPWIAVVMGIVFAIRAAAGSVAPMFLVIGPALVVIGIAAFFLFRWMGKRGI